MKCIVCGDPTPQTCDGCGRPHCAFCLRSDEAGQWCDECDQRNAAESLEAVGGEAVARAHARAIRAQREYDMEGKL